MSVDNTGLAIKQASRIEKFHDGECEPFEVVESDGVWTDLEGNEITDPDRIARLEAKARGE